MAPRRARESVNTTFNAAEKSSDEELVALGPSPLQLTSENKDEPLEVAAYATESMLYVHVAIDDEWHIYAPGSTAGVPIVIKAHDKSAYEIAGDIVVTDQSDQGEISGQSIIRVPLRKKDSGDQLAIDFEYQVCDALRCLPPSTFRFLGKPSYDGPRTYCLLLSKRVNHPSIMPNDEDWNAWYESYQDRIVFIESTGFWWQVDPRVLERQASVTKNK